MSTLSGDHPTLGLNYLPCWATEPIADLSGRRLSSSRAGNGSADRPDRMMQPTLPGNDMSTSTFVGLNPCQPRTYPRPIAPRVGVVRRFGGMPICVNEKRAFGGMSRVKEEWGIRQEVSCVTVFVIQLVSRAGFDGQRS